MRCWWPPYLIVLRLYAGNKNRWWWCNEYIDGDGSISGISAIWLLQYTYAVPFLSYFCGRLSFCPPAKAIAKAITVMYEYLLSHMTSIILASCCQKAALGSTEICVQIFSRIKRKCAACGGQRVLRHRHRVWGAFGRLDFCSDEWPIVVILDTHCRHIYWSLGLAIDLLIDPDFIYMVHFRSVNLPPTRPSFDDNNLLHPKWSFI